MTSDPTFADVAAAAERIRGAAHETPVLTCRSLDAHFGMRLHFKCENFQKVGAFKFRGATNTIRQLPDSEAARGVVTHSSGNHAQALALAAREAGIPAWVVMPTTAPAVKRAAVEGYGATVIPCEPTLEAREENARRVIEETGAVFVHPYDDPRIIAGQGTAALELMRETYGLAAVLVPVGGGGLASGTCLAVHGCAPNTDVYGAEPEAVDDARRGLAAGHLVPVGSTPTIADGLKTSLSERTFSLLQRHLEDIRAVSEAEIHAAMRLVFERMKIVIEPSAAVPVAALEHLRTELAGQHVGVVLSGGNVDLDVLAATGTRSPPL